MYATSLFSEEFFTGNGEYDLYDMPISDRPTNVYQAIISLPREDQIGIARDVMNSPYPEIYVDTESFAFNVLEQIKKTDLCDDLSNPVTVYIDTGRNYSVTVYDFDSAV